MAMTLDEMLALLPDNSTGQISAADLRSIVTDMYHLAASLGQAFSYVWETSDTSPGSGKVTMDQPWQSSASQLYISETTQDGAVLTFAGVDNAFEAQIWVNNATGSSVRAKVTGPSVDLGSYRQIPISVMSVTGASPANNEKVSVSIVTVTA
jgi:hypothetical protein